MPDVHVESISFFVLHGFYFLVSNLFVFQILCFVSVCFSHFAFSTLLKVSCIFEFDLFFLSVSVLFCFSRLELELVSNFFTNHFKWKHKQKITDLCVQW